MEVIRNGIAASSCGLYVTSYHSVCGSRVASVGLLFAVAAVGGDDSLVDQGQSIRTPIYQIFCQIPVWNSLQMPTFDHGASSKVNQRMLGDHHLPQQNHHELQSLKLWDQEFQKEQSHLFFLLLI